MKYHFDPTQHDPFKIQEQILKDHLAERLVREGNTDNSRIAEILEMPESRVKEIYRDCFDALLGRLFRKSIWIFIIGLVLFITYMKFIY